MLMIRTPTKKSVQAYTLIELMIAIVIGMIVTAAAISMYITAIKGSSNTLKNAQLTEDLSFAMRLMTDDIRRSGYWGAAVTGSDAKNNTFTSVYIPNTNDCILYTYDADGDAAITPDPESNEYYGFKLNRGVIQIKTSGNATSATNCALGTWQDLTDNNQINVTSLWICDEGLKWINSTDGNTGPTTTPSFTDTTCSDIDPSTDLPSGTNAASSGDLITEIRQIEIVINAESQSDSTIQAQVSDSVAIRNNVVYIEP